MRPQRLVLSRAAGFDLQGHSLALNGLPERSVARPGRWGNPFTIAAVMAEQGVGYDAAQAEAVARFGHWAGGAPGVAVSAPPPLATIKTELAGQNLACWCKPGTPCHADILIALANGE